MKIFLSILATTILVDLIALPPAFGRDKLVFTTFENAGITLVQEPVVREVYRRLGYEIEVRQVPGERALLLADRGKVDGELGRLETVREMYGNLIMVPEPIHEIRGLVVTKNADFTPAGWESLKPYPVLSLRGYKYFEGRLKGHQIKYHLVNRFEDMLKFLQAGRYDIGLITWLDGLKTMKKWESETSGFLSRRWRHFPYIIFCIKRMSTWSPS